MKNILHFICIALLALSCTPKQEYHPSTPQTQTKSADTLIIDSKYSFEEAIKGSNAPQHIIDQLSLIDVKYYSTDNKIHQGQVLTNKKIAEDIKSMFYFMFAKKFPVAKAIPIVKYGWSDKLSMQDNNTYSFCYRNVSFSAHAIGMAIDINPFFNPMRWKEGHIYGNRRNQPEGASYNPSVPGTFTPESEIVLEFKKRRFHWGRSMTEKFDDHHFEKAGLRLPKKIKTDSILTDSI